MQESNWKIQAGVGAVVLCGGRSRRMGRPKEWLRFGGEYLLQRMVRIAASVGHPVVVAARAGQSLPELARDVGVVYDAPGPAGPLAGLAAGFAALRGARDAAVVVSCDAPLVRGALLKHLVSLLNDSPAVVPEHHGRLQPLVAVYRLATEELLHQLLARGERSMAAFVEACGARIVPSTELCTADADLRSFHNVNTPKEYEEALRLVACDG